MIALLELDKNDRFVIPVILKAQKFAGRDQLCTKQKLATNEHEKTRIYWKLST
jgi:hypothetical protein